MEVYYGFLYLHKGNIVAILLPSELSFILLKLNSSKCIDHVPIEANVITIFCSSFPCHAKIYGPT